ncbi:Gfo/Idh/MocA family oxidoreductase, partial [Candidatus Thorarchaeota archaeon]
MSEDARLGLGLIGIGNVGTAHLSALRTLQEANLIPFEVRAVCDTDTAILKKASEKFGVGEAFETHKELVAEKSIDIVFVMTPTIRHGDIIKDAAKAGKAVYSKKPLAHSAPQARELNAVVIDAGVQSGVALVLRHDPFILYARELLASNDFGRPMSAHIRTDQRIPEGIVARNGEGSDVEVPGRGTLVEQSVHDLDLLSWFLGTPRSVLAKFGFFSGRGVEDLAVVMLEHEGDVLSTLTSVWHSIDRPNERMIELFFENGYVGISLESGKSRLDYQLGDDSPVRIHSETANRALLEHLDIDPNEVPLEVY